MLNIVQIAIQGAETTSAINIQEQTPTIPKMVRYGFLLYPMIGKQSDMKPQRGLIIHGIPVNELANDTAAGDMPNHCFRRR